MKNLKIYRAGFYTNADHFIQEPEYLFLLFQTSGLDYLRTDNFEIRDSKPFCYLFFAGDKFEYEFNKKREDWVIQFSFPEIKRISDKQFSFAASSENIILPRYLEIAQNDLLRWKNKFNAVISSSATPLPRDQVMAQLHILDIFRYYIEAVGKEGQTSPAAKLKQLIDMPENIKFSLAELSEKCGYSIDHLRILFKNKYEILPQEYRIHHTMIYAMKLICNSDLVISDIADQCGFKYLSHFSALFKKTHGLPPNKALKRFRYQ